MGKILAILVLPFLFGCGVVQDRIVPVVQRDLAVSIQRGERALGPNDALVVCYKALDEVLKAQATADELEGGLLLDAIMRARILEQVKAKVGDTLKKACGEITVEVLIQAARN